MNKNMLLKDISCLAGLEGLLSMIIYFMFFIYGVYVTFTLPNTIMITAVAVLGMPWLTIKIYNWSRNRIPNNQP